MFKLFTNIKKIHIQINGDLDGMEFFTLSFLALLTIIKEQHLTKVAISSYVKPRSSSYKSWLQLLWDNASRDLIDKYKKEKLDINFEHKINEYGSIIDTISIKVMS